MLRLSGIIMSIIVILTSCQQDTEEGIQPNDNLNAVLWMQRSAEYRALCYMTFELARKQLQLGLDDKNWSAISDLPANSGDLPPAIVLDIDETVLDNSPYEAQLIEMNQNYTSESWRDWVEEARARAISGAAEFCRYAAESDIGVFYITNRRSVSYNATRENLIKAGFPQPIDAKHLLMRTDTADKSARRKAVADSNRIILMLGDNCGDFYGGYTHAGLDVRDSLVQIHRALWGNKWIILPNPSYGDWEAALYGYDYKLTDPQKRKLKIKKMLR